MKRRLRNAAGVDESDLTYSSSRRGRLGSLRPTMKLFGQVEKLIVPGQAIGQSQANGGSLTQIRCIHRTHPWRGVLLCGIKRGPRFFHSRRAGSYAPGH
jgi:hypothetical protein